MVELVVDLAEELRMTLVFCLFDQGGALPLQKRGTTQSCLRPKAARCRGGAEDCFKRSLPRVTSELSPFQGALHTHVRFASARTQEV